MQIIDKKHESAPFSVPEGMGKILIDLGVAELYTPPQPQKTKAFVDWRVVRTERIAPGRSKPPTIEATCTCSTTPFYFDTAYSDEIVLRHQSRCELTHSRPPADVLAEYLRLRKIYYKRANEAAAAAANDPLARFRATLPGR